MMGLQHCAGDAFSVPMFINGAHTNLLLDTGAARSFLRAELIPESLVSKTDVKAIGPSGEIIQIVGQAILPITAGNFRGEHNFLLAKDIGSNGLLGADFCRAHKVENIDFKHAKIRLKNSEIPFKIINGPKKPTSAARALRIARSCSIKPRCGEAVACTVDAPAGSIGMACNEFERAKNLEKGMLIGNSVVRVNNSNIIHVPVSNFKSDEKVKLKQGQIIGQFENINRQTTVLPQQPANMTRNKKQTLSGLLPPVDLSLADISSEQKTEIEKLLIKYNNIFAKDANDLGLCTLVEHKITTTGPPVRQPLRRTTREEKEIMKPELDKMLKAGIIVPTDSPWASNLVLVRKRDGSVRMCVDYRALNSQTQKDPWPLPRIDDCIDSLSGAKYFSSLDMLSSFWQIPIFKPDIPKTAFISPFGNFAFTRMAMGLVGSGATFSRCMNIVFADLIRADEVLVYLDDILAHSPTFKEHLKRLEAIFIRLQNANLKVKPTKTHICKKEVEFLGFLVSGNGVRVNPEKTRPILEWPTPQNVGELRCALGMFVYYKKFIKDYAKIALPLNTLLKKNTPYNWGKDQENAFNILKQKLTTPPILGFPQYHLPYIIRTDASGFGLGAVLSQEQPTGEQGGRTERRVIAYASRKLSEAEKKLAATEREMIGACWAVLHFKPYLRTKYKNGEVILETDANPIAALNQQRDTSPKMGRYKMMLQEYNIKWKYTPGPQNGNADGLSRTPDRRSSEQKLVDDKKIEQEMEEPLDNLLQLNAVHILTPETISRRRFILEQQKDAQVQKILGHRQDISNWDEMFVIEDGLLKRTQGKHRQIVVPRPLQDTVMFICHDQNGHLGLQKCFVKLQERFYWKGYQSDLEKYIISCLECQRRQPPPQQVAPLQSIVAYRPLELMSWDVTGMAISDKGYRYLLVMLDVFSSFVEIFPLTNQDAGTIISCFKSYVYRYGVPLRVQSDNGGCFAADATKEIMRIFGCKATYSSPYRSSSVVERTHRTIKNMVSKMTIDKQKKWHEHIDAVKFAINTSISDTHQFTPFILWFSRPPQLPIDVLLQSSPEPISKIKFVADSQKAMRQAFELVRERADKARQYRREYMATHKNQPEELQVGQLVLMYCPVTKQGDSRKMNCPWYGPYFVIGKAGPVNYYIRLMDGSKQARLVHANFLKPLKGEPGDIGFRKGQDEPTGPLRPLDSDLFDFLEENDNTGQPAPVNNQVNVPAPQLPPVPIVPPSPPRLSLTPPPGQTPPAGISPIINNHQAQLSPPASTDEAAGAGNQHVQHPQPLQNLQLDMFDEIWPANNSREATPIPDRHQLMEGDFIVDDDNVVDMIENDYEAQDEPVQQLDNPTVPTRRQNMTADRQISSQDLTTNRTRSGNK